MVDIKMYMSEISKFKISDLKAQKMIILWTMKHVSAIRKHPVHYVNDKKDFNITGTCTDFLFVVNENFYQAIKKPKDKLILRKFSSIFKALHRF